MEQIYHVYNRGVDRRNVFLNDEDYYRFIHDLFEFNDVLSTDNNFGRIFNQLRDVQHPSIEKHPLIGEERKLRKRRDFLVEIIAFCLMPNHYHLLLRPVKDNGIILFMKKMGGGYTNYFNEKYKRSGALFQGRYKKVLVENPNHFEYLGFYTHCNSLDLKYPEWRDGKISNAKEAMEYLENYRWSSLPDYLGKKNFPSVTQRELLQHQEGPLGYKNQLQEWLSDLERNKKFLIDKTLTLE